MYYTGCQGIFNTITKSKGMFITVYMYDINFHSTNFPTINKFLTDWTLFLKTQQKKEKVSKRRPFNQYQRQLD